jgi:hypothetical protein
VRYLPPPNRPPTVEEVTLALIKEQYERSEARARYLGERS